MGFFMKTKLALLGAAAALSLLSAQQSSAHHQGWYVGGEAGINWISDNDIAFEDNFASTDAFSNISLDSGTVNFDAGWAGLATVGYGFEKNWRIELEGGYRSNDFNAAVNYFDSNVECRAAFQTELGCPGTATAKGSFDEWTAMVNVVYDVPLTDKLDLNIGVGAGADFSRVKAAGFKDDDTNFAYQAIVGLSYKVTDRLDLTVNYRYLNVDSPSYTADLGFDAVATANFQDVQKHTVTIGLRYDLEPDEAPVVMAPPAPLPPAPAAAAEPEQFVIFFGFDKCNITAEADAVLGEAASAAKTQGAVKVSIVGHTDTMGSDAYNKKLSECRANAARTNLVAKGISAATISAEGHGETELLVKTQDSVKEPQNRRATIDLSK
jgi:outer membrane protein OmpA-like peptidoglycan-associated protein